jgi:hypothetical protein
MILGGALVEEAATAAEERESVSFCVEESMEETGFSFVLDRDQDRNRRRL